MRVLVFEFLTGGGWNLGKNSTPPAALLAEGHAMVAALTEDFAQLPHVRTELLWDARLPTAVAWPDNVMVHSVTSENARTVLIDRAVRADWTVLIAPEFNHHLLKLASAVVAAGGRLLGPSPDLIRLATDKQLLAEHLTRHAVPAARGQRLSAVQGGATWPAGNVVLKPCDGAGSQGVQLLSCRPSANHAAWQRPDQWRVERFYPGLAASVSLLCGPEEPLALPACRQQLADDDSFAYLGGSYPLPDSLADRASRLALAAAATCQGALGYIGVDLVLGAADDGSQDVVIEVNPRLTTSYVGLRAVCQQNLAAAMLSQAQGETPSLAFDRRAIRFAANGDVKQNDIRA